MSQPEKVFWSEEEKSILVMRAIELRMQRMWESISSARGVDSPTSGLASAT
jgi:hypothetical protein